MRVHRKCCGLDVHKKMIAACLLTEDAGGQQRYQEAPFRKHNARAARPCALTVRRQVTAVAMEANRFLRLTIHPRVQPPNRRFRETNQNRHSGCYKTGHSTLPPTQSLQLSIPLG